MRYWVRTLFWMFIGALISAVIIVICAIISLGITAQGS